MTVGETLYFAARARQQRMLPSGISKKKYAEFMRDVVMASEFPASSLRAFN